MKKQVVDRFLDQSTLVLLALLWIYTIVSYRSLPEIIPAHYGLDGKADRYDHKRLIFLLPVILTVIVSGLRFLNRFPHKFNYLAVVTKENAEEQHRVATRMIRVISFIIVIAFSYTVVKTIHDSTKPASFLDWWFIPLLLISLFGTVVYFIWRGFKVG